MDVDVGADAMQGGAAGRAQQASPGSIVIPIQGGAEFVEVFVNELPDDVNDVIEVLKAEIAPLDVWLRFAVEYYRQGKISQFEELLTEGSKPEMEQFYRNSASERIAILSALASHFSNKGQADKRHRKDLFQKATDCLNAADKINRSSEGGKHDATLALGRGLYYLTCNEQHRAEPHFDNALQADANSVPALLGKAQIRFQEKNYLGAFEHYKRAIIKHPGCPAAVRVGLGICLYHLGKKEAALRAMKRALDLEPNNVEAMVGVAILTLARCDAEVDAEVEAAAAASGAASVGDVVGVQRAKRAMALLRQAFELNQKHAMVLNHLSNNVFWRWERAVGTLSVRHGQQEATCSVDVAGAVKPGARVKIDQETYSVRKVGQGGARGLLLDRPYAGPTAAAATWWVKDLDKSLNLAREAYQFSRNPRVQAESYYFVGRAYQAKGEYDSALHYFTQATALWPEFPLAQLGLGQMLVYKRNPEQAVECFEKVLAFKPDCAEAHYCLGSLLAQLGRLEPALKSLQRVTELDADHVDAWVEQARILQRSGKLMNYRMALVAYEKAGASLGRRRLRVPVELWCNVGALRHKLGRLQDARRAYVQAVVAAQRQSELEGDAPAEEEVPEAEAARRQRIARTLNVNVRHLLRARCVTVAYNLARLCESLGDHALAEDLYHSIVSKHPYYVDALLRLGCMRRDRNDNAGAARYFEKAVHVARDVYSAEGEGRAARHSADAVLLLGNQAAGRKQWGAAQKRYEELLGARALKSDAYAMLALGNVFFETLDEPERYVKHLRYAADLYHGVLQRDSYNVFATNGLAMVMAHKGRLDKAEQAFAAVREAGETGEAALNLAHVALLRGDHPRAIQLYQHCNKRYHEGRSCEVLQYLAFAYFDAEMSTESARVLTLAVRADPSDLRAWYNLAVVSASYATFVLQSTSATASVPGSKSATAGGRKFERTVEDVKKAVAALKRAAKLFEWLAQQREPERGGQPLPYVPENAAEYATFCANTMPSALDHLRFEEEQVERKQQEMERRQEFHRQLVERRQQERERERGAQEAAAAAAQRVALEQAERLEQLKVVWQKKEQDEKRRKQQKKAEDAGSVIDEAEDAGSVMDEAEQRELVGSGSEAEGDAPAAAAPNKQKQKQKPKQKQKQKQKQKRKRRTVATSPSASPAPEQDELGALSEEEEEGAGMATVFGPEDEEAAPAPPAPPAPPLPPLPASEQPLARDTAADDVAGAEDDNAEWDRQLAELDLEGLDDGEPAADADADGDAADDTAAAVSGARRKREEGASVEDESEASGPQAKRARVEDE